MSAVCARAQKILHSDIEFTVLVLIVSFSFLFKTYFFRSWLEIISKLGREKIKLFLNSPDVVPPNQRINASTGNRRSCCKFSRLRNTAPVADRFNRFFQRSHNGRSAFRWCEWWTLKTFEFLWHSWCRFRWISCRIINDFWKGNDLNSFSEGTRKCWSSLLWSEFKVGFFFGELWCNL